MNTMNMPGFTAETSLYQTSKPYGMAATLEAIELSTTLYPQMMSRATGPDGPITIGFPGQSCNAACMHLCWMDAGWGGGSFFEECMSDCTSACGELSFNARL